jgi:hypothetical protein
MVALVPAAAAQPPTETEYTPVITDNQDYPVGFYDLREVALGEFTNVTGHTSLVVRITVTDWDSVQSPYGTISVFYEHGDQTWRSTVDSEGRPVRNPEYPAALFEDCVVESGVAYCWFGLATFNLTAGDKLTAPFALSYAGASAGDTSQGVGQDYAPGGLANDATNGPTGDDYVIKGGPEAETGDRVGNGTAGNETPTDGPSATSPVPVGGSSPTPAAGILLATLVACAWCAARRR